MANNVLGHLICEHLQDVYYFPPRLLGVKSTPSKDSCLYDLDFMRIDNTCVYRGVKNINCQPVSLEKGQRNHLIEDVCVVEHPVLYGGFITHHFGHFITEGLARLWALDKNPNEYRHIAFLGAEINEMALSVLNVLGVDKSNIIQPQKVTKFSNITIPSAGLVLKKGMSQHMKDYIQNGVRSILNINANRLANRCQGIYMSRRLIDKNDRPIVNELELEQELLMRGYRICHPQHLSIVDQIIEINSCDKIIGPLGSAMHNLLWRLYPCQPIYLLFSGRSIKNYKIIDDAYGFDGKYVHNAVNCNESGSVQYDIDLIMRII